MAYLQKYWKLKLILTRIGDKVCRSRKWSPIAADDSEGRTFTQKNKSNFQRKILSGGRKQCALEERAFAGVSGRLSLSPLADKNSPLEGRMGMKGCCQRRDLLFTTGLSINSAAGQ